MRPRRSGSPGAALPAFPWVNTKWFARAPDLALLCVAVLFLNNLTLVPPRAGFDTDGHVEYIRMIEERDALPTAADGWETHQPPLFYLAGAFLLKVTRTSLPSETYVAVLQYQKDS